MFDVGMQVFDMVLVEYVVVDLIVLVDVGFGCFYCVFFGVVFLDFQFVQFGCQYFYCVVVVLVLVVVGLVGYDDVGWDVGDMYC